MVTCNPHTRTEKSSVQGLTSPRWGLLNMGSSESVSVWMTCKTLVPEPRTTALTHETLPTHIKCSPSCLVEILISRLTPPHGVITGVGQYGESVTETEPVFCTKPVVLKSFAPRSLKESRTVESVPGAPRHSFELDQCHLSGLVFTTPMVGGGVRPSTGSDSLGKVLVGHRSGEQWTGVYVLTRVV